MKCVPLALIFFYLFTKISDFIKLYIKLHNFKNDLLKMSDLTFDIDYNYY